MGTSARSRAGRHVVRTIALVVVVTVAAAGCLFVPGDDTTPGAVAARQHVNGLLDQAQVAHAGGDDQLAQQLREQAAADECQSFGCPPAVGPTSVAMDPTHAGGFFAAPWPSDTRRHANGSIDLTGFPGRSTVPLADVVLGRGEAATFGFGTNSAVFFQTTAAIAPASIPVFADLSTHLRSSAMLLDLDHPGSPPVPLLADFKVPGTALRPADLLTLLPYPGHPLAPGTRYAAVLFNGLTDTSGQRLAPAPIISQLDGAAPANVSPSTWTQLRDERDAASQAVRSRTLWHPSEMVAFSVFTTQDPTAEMHAIAAAVAALPAPQVLSRTPDLSACPAGGVSHTTGRLALPRWQQGTPPFINDGGGIVTVNGIAQQQGVELGTSGQGVLLDMAIPCGPAPAAGWPILLWMNGTGGTARAAPITQLGTNLPYAVLSIAPYFSGDRNVVAPAPFDTPEFQFYNYTNPVGARTNELQQAGDMIYLQRIAQGLAFGPTEAGGVGHLDASKVVMAGHSQGALTLPLTLAFDPGVKGAFLSSGGADLYHSIVHRGDVRQLVDGILGSQPGELDIFHPYPQILQTFAEPGDAANYAAHVDTNVAIYAGLRDGCSPIEVSVTLAQAMGVPIAHPVTRQPVFGLSLSSTSLEPGLVVPPVSGNLPSGKTGVMVEVDDGHFGARDYPAIGRSFVDSLVATGVATVDPGATPPHDPGTGCVRFDAPPTP
jgi:hypothetical protein